MHILKNKPIIRVGNAALCVGLFLTAIFPSLALAATNNGGEALEIAPPVIYLSANPGQTLSTQILIRDIAGGNMLVSGQVNDFVAQGTDGTPKILLNSTEEANDPYAMKSWVTALPGLDLVPQQIKPLTVTINVPITASPGGHYAVIRFTGTPPSLQGSGVSLTASIGVLVLLTVSGKIVNHLSVTQFYVSQNNKKASFFQNGPVQFNELIKNTGNEQEQPTGIVTVKDMFGSVLANVPVNVPPSNVLPSSSRLYHQPLNSDIIGNKKLFGRYTANLTLSYGSSPKQTLTTSISFWVIPYKLIAIVIIILVAGFFLLRYLIRRYNQYVLKQAQKRSRR